MIELSKHIEILLLEHNCVIVPQLGGFITQEVPARYVAEENLFLPPHRTVGFNPELTLNDGLLVQSYMQEYDTNYPETLKLIEQAVSNLKAEIQEKGEFELNGIGKITLNIDGQYYFEPNEAGILSPSLYGLDSVVVKPSEKKELATTVSEKKQTQSVQSVHNGKNYTFSINKELVNYVAAAVVAIFFYFVWATPVTDSSSMSAQQASMLFPHKVQRVQQQEVHECVPVDTTARQEVFQEEESPAVSQPTPQAETDNESYYTIVLVSCVPLKNAELFADEIKEEGYANTFVLNKRHLIRVVHGKYNSESEAYTSLHQLRKESNRFDEAWILHNH